MADTRIELLSPQHEKGSFDCGKAPLNSFLQQHAGGNASRGVSRVYVVTRGTDSRVLGYYACSAGTFRRDQLPAEERKGLPGYPLPTAHLGRLAVDRSCQGQRLGELLLFHFLRTACEAADKIGVFAVDLIAKDNDAKRFYLKYGFRALQDNASHLYLPLATVRAMFEQIVPGPSATPAS